MGVVLTVLLYAAVSFISFLLGMIVGIASVDEGIRNRDHILDALYDIQRGRCLTVPPATAHPDQPEGYHDNTPKDV